MNTEGLVNWMVPITIILSFFSQSTVVPQMIGYLMVVTSITVICFLLFRSGLARLHIPRTVLFPLLILVFMTSLAVIVDQTLGDVQRLFIFFTVSVAIIFWIPQIASFDIVFYRFAILTTIMVVLTSPTLFINEFGVGIFTISSWHTTSTIPVIGFEYNTFSGIFINPNTLSLVCCLSSLCLLKEVYQQHMLSIIAFGINGIAVYLSGGRSGIAALLIGTTLFISYLLFQDEGLLYSSVLGWVLGMVGFLSIFGIGPVSISLDLSQRQELWIAAVHAVIDQPIIGYGPADLGNVLGNYGEFVSKGPHNSYLKMVLSGGVLSGLSYVFLYGFAIWRSLWGAKDLSGTVLYVLLIATATISMFEGTSAFGISTLSILFGLILGYGIFGPKEKVPS
ncbi:O-antigen ligase family protein [Natrinema limicola]|uniref:O-antigen ligase-related domain-containing protein n=1 Tax=Natrinema limicola JCM 13563 TaxID=1230457 RepID=M0CXB5_9EURY|nr:O-antigen ligase family protein [Natrinema limicola]ELZ26504.1 hypothetical protein C476_00042 [Natrinema limicola JCM 13563]